MHIACTHRMERSEIYMEHCVCSKLMRFKVLELCLISERYFYTCWYRICFFIEIILKICFSENIVKLVRACFRLCKRYYKKIRSKLKLLLVAECRWRERYQQLDRHRETNRRKIWECQESLSHRAKRCCGRGGLYFKTLRGWSDKSTWQKWRGKDDYHVR